MAVQDSADPMDRDSGGHVAAPCAQRPDDNHDDLEGHDDHDDELEQDDQPAAKSGAVADSETGKYAEMHTIYIIYNKYTT